MSIETAVATELKNDAALSSLAVGIFPHIAPDSAEYPFINYQILSSNTENYLNKSPSDLTLTDTEIELSIFTKTVSERAAITTRIKNLLHGFSGDLGTENLNIRGASMQSFSTFSEEDLTGSDEQIYRASLAFNFTYNWS